MVVGVRFRWIRPLGSLFFLLLLGSLLAKGLHLVAFSFITEGLDGILLFQLAIGAGEGDFLGAGLISVFDLDLGVFGNTIQLLERRTDVLFTTGSSDAGHAHNVSCGFGFFCDSGGKTECHRDCSNE